MKSQTSFVLFLLVATGASAAQEPPHAGADYGAPPPSSAPQGSSQLRPGEARFDRVGRITLAEGEGTFALSGELAAGSFAEVTALDTGRTILVQVRGEGSGLVALSPAAAAQLGVATDAPVRIRRVTVTPQDTALLSAGRAAPTRADAPQALLVGLRRMLAEQPAPVRPAARPAQAAAAKPKPVKPQPVKPEPVPAQPARAEVPKPVPVKVQPAPKPAARGNLIVQVAALSNVQRARTLADQLGGSVRSAGNIHRVQLGPFADRAAAERARADAAKRGYGDARILSNP
ncbi:SPOR domain-containing protein [Sphingomonas koreensis]|nr:SPOR domain-containing protein [Sphingomonas koreensis]